MSEQFVNLLGSKNSKYNILYVVTNMQLIEINAQFIIFYKVTKYIYI